MRISDIIWKAQIVDKLAVKHHVTEDEAEEALFFDPVFRKMANGRIKGEDVYAALSQISSGRYLIVFFIDKQHGLALPISARDMTDAEKEY